MIRWSKLTLSRQVAILILISLLLIEVSSAGIDIWQIMATHEAEVRSRGMAFIREVLPTLENEDAEQQQSTVSTNSNFERRLSVTGTAAALALPSYERHRSLERNFRAALRREGYPVEEVVMADMPLVPSRDGTTLGSSLVPTENSKGELWPHFPSPRIREAIYSIRLEGRAQWYNFYLLVAPTAFWPIFIARSLDGAIAAILLIGLGIVVNRVMRPVGALASSAEQLGRGENVDTLPLSGSADVRQTVEAFNRMSARISHSRDYQVALLGSLGHDLKGPLSGVRHAASEAMPDDVKDALLRRLARADDIVNSVTNFARETRRDGPTVVVDLPSLLFAIADEQEEDGHQVDVSVEANVAVIGRHTALMRAIRNLVENAVKYGGRADVTLTVQDRYAVIWVDDEGEGLSPDQLETAFRPFERLGAKAPGSGLGLAIVRTIVIDHGGTVALENREGGGLRAIVRLPLETRN